MTPTVIEDRAFTRRYSFFSVLICAWPALLITTVCLLPFLNKAFLIDDPFFLAQAQQIIKHPLHPMDFDICWNLADACNKAYALTPGNALMGYALVPTVLGGSSEWMAHFTQLVFAWIAVIAMSSLVLRFGWNRGHARIGALLLVAIPPFLPMASTAMPDILAMTVGLVAMERLAAWKAHYIWHQGTVAAVALGLAGFARSHLVLLLPLGAFFLLESTNFRKILLQIRQQLWLWTPVVAGTVLLLTTILITRERSVALDPPAAFRGGHNILPNFASYLLYFAFPLPLAACWVANRWKTGHWRPLAITLAVGIAGISIPNYRLPAFLAAFGLGALTDLLLRSWQNREHMEIFLWFWLLIPLPIVYYGHLPIKYLLPCIPALILTCFRLSAPFSARVAKIAGVGLIIAGIGYSLLILHSDAEFANFGRIALDRLIRPHVAAGEKVWFGGQFSSYWYAPKAGAILSPADGPQPKPGDLFVVGLFEGGDVTLRRFPNRTLIETISHTYRFGRTMGGGMGLYYNRMGVWLWGFGESGLDRYELWRIN